MKNLSPEERALIDSGVTMTNVVHVCAMALSRMSHTIPTQVDGVNHSNLSIAAMMAKGILDKVGEEYRNAS